MPNFYGAIDLQKNELRQAVVQNLASAPATPATGQLWYDSANQILKWWNGTTWIPAMSGGALTPASTVTTQAVGDAPVVGTSANYAREDHKHGREAFGAITAETTFGTSSGNGVAATLARSDHTHGNPVHDATAHTALLGNVTPEPTFGSASSNGVATTLARSDHAHGNPTHVAADHATIPLSAFAVPTAAVSFGGQRITNLADPTTATDAATKQYTDGLVAGVTWKNPCRVASTANLAALSGLLTIDGVTVAANDRVLVKNQTTASANGIYVAAAGAWTRATDADASAELVNASVYVSEGTTQADTAWVQTVNAPITVGTTNLTWVQFSGPNTFSAGAGLTLTGNVFDVVAADTTLTVNPDSIQVNTAVIATVASVSAGYQPVDTDLTALANNATNGIWVRTGTGTGAARSIVGTLPVTVTNGDGVAGNPTVAVSVFGSAAAGVVPASGGGTANYLRADGTWAAPPGPAAGTPVGKYAAALTGTVAYATGEVVTHNLNTRDIDVIVINSASPYQSVTVDWEATTVNTVTLRYNPNLGAGFRVVVQG